MPATARPPIADDKARAQLTPDAKALLGRLAAALEGENDWSEKRSRRRSAASPRREGVKLGQVAQPLRVALTGSTASPGIFEVAGDPGTRRDQAEIAGRRRIERLAPGCATVARDGLARLDLAAVAFRPVGRVVLLRQGRDRRTRTVHRGVRAAWPLAALALESLGRRSAATRRAVARLFRHGRC